MSTTVIRYAPAPATSAVRIGVGEYSKNILSPAENLMRSPPKFECLEIRWNLVESLGLRPHVHVFCVGEMNIMHKYNHIIRSHSCTHLPIYGIISQLQC